MPSPQGVRIPSQSLQIIRDLCTHSPLHAAATVVLLLLAGLAEGVGFVTLLPVLSIATGQPAASGTALESGIVDALATVGLSPTLPILLVVVTLGVLIKAAFTMLASVNISTASADMAARLREDLVRNVLRSSWLYFVSQPTGRLTNAISSEAQQAASAYGAVTNFAATAIQVAVFSVIALLASWQVTVVGLLVGLAMVILLQKLVGIARRAGGRQVTLMNVLVSHMTDVLALIKPLKAMGQEDRAGPLLRKSSEGINRAQRSLQVATVALSTIQEPLFTVFLAVGVYVTLTFGGYTLVNLLFMAVLFQRIVVRTASLQIQYQKLASIEGAYFSMQEVIQNAANRREEVVATGAPPSLKHGIKLESVTFSYDDAPILSDLNLEIPANRLTALVGPSGVGKTTVGDLVIGLLQPTSGRVTIDDQDLKTIDQHAWRTGIGYVPQELILLNDTIYANVSLGDEAIGREEVDAALWAAGASEFVSSLPGGIDSLVGERGAKLSGGQRQRISLARALARKPRLLVLDEPTTALDPATEQAICQTLRALTQETTILAISHQSALVEAADVVHRLQGNRLHIKGAAA